MPRMADVVGVILDLYVYDSAADEKTGTSHLIQFLLDQARAGITFFMAQSQVSSFKRAERCSNAMHRQTELNSPLFFPFLLLIPTLPYHFGLLSGSLGNLLRSGVGVFSRKQNVCHQRRSVGFL